MDGMVSSFDMNKIEHGRKNWNAAGSVISEIIRAQTDRHLSNGRKPFTNGKDSVGILVITGQQ